MHKLINYRGKIISVCYCKDDRSCYIDFNKGKSYQYLCQNQSKNMTGHTVSNIQRERIMINANN